MSIRLTKAAAAVAGAALLAATLTACQSDSAASFLAEARQYQQKGDNKAAIIQLKNALEKNPDDVEARFLLAQVSLDMEDPLTAEKEVRRAIALNYAADKTTPVLARALAQQSRHQDLLDATEKVVQTPEVLALRGSAYLGLGKGDEGKAAFDAALAKQPNHADALAGLSRYAAMQKDWTLAQQLVDKAIAADAKNINAWQLKGDLQRAQNKPQEAMAAYQQVLKLKPGHRTAHLEQAELNIAAGKYDAAQADIDAARKNGANGGLIAYNQALLDFSRDRMKDAQANLLKVMQVAPNHMPSVLLSGAVALNLGQLEQAEKHLRKYVEWSPANLYARKMLVSTLLKTQQPAEAENVLAPALKDDKADASVLELAGEAAMLQQQPAKASKYFEQAIALDPKRGSVHVALGLAKLAQGDRAGGAAELEAATKLAPASIEAGSTLVRVQTSTGEYDKALASVALLEKAHPNSAVLHNLKGGAYLGKKDVKAARASFGAALAADATYFPAAANLAQLDLQDKNPAAAKQRFDSILQKDAKNADAMTALAEIALTEGDKAKATGWLEKAVASQPDALAPALKLGEHYINLATPQKALTLLGKHALAHPANPQLLDVQGRAQLANKDVPGAIETFSKLVSVEPKSGAAQLRLATAEMQRKNPAAAGAALKKAIAVEPGFMQAYLAQAELAAGQRNYDAALATVRQVQQRFPKSPVGQLLEGDLWMQQNKPAQAVRPYEAAFAIAPTAPMLMKLGKALQAGGKSAEADRRVAEWRRQHPDEPLAAMYAAENHIAAKQYRQAITELEAVLKKVPDNLVALNNLAWAYQQEKDARALPTAEKAYALAGKNPMVMDTLGWMLVEQGNTARGLPLLQEAAKLAPEAGEIRLHLAQGLQKAGDKNNARKELEYLTKGKFSTQQEEARSLLKLL